MSQPSQPNAIVLAIKGLVLNPSTFDTQVPDGSLTIADNVVIDRPSVVATRRGFSNYWGANPIFGIPSELTPLKYKALSMFQFDNHILKHVVSEDVLDENYISNALCKITYEGIPSQATETVYNNGLGSYYQFYQPDIEDSESRIRAVDLNNSFYFITRAGTYRLDDIDGTPRLAGTPPGLGGSAVIDGAVGFLPKDTNIAYRVVFGYKDANEQLVLGAPSGRILCSNTSPNSANVYVTFQVPQEVRKNPQNFFFQVYRGSASANLTTEPDDEMALVYEDICSTILTPIDSGGNITILDITPVNLVGASLYTNQGQDGILQSNYRPPWAIDICTFKQYTFYANTKTLHTANLTLIAAGASNGADALDVGDWITFTPVDALGDANQPFTIVASTINDPALGFFKVSNTGNPAYDIQVTATNMINIANAYAANIITSAYYTSTPNELPGKMRFDRIYEIETPTYPFNTPFFPTGLEPYPGFTVPFTITSNKSTCWEQVVTDGLTPTLTSTNEAKPNRIYYSKFSQPDAVPVVNYLDVGSANAPIRRVVPLRDGVMVLKDDGIFRISNAAPPFVVTPIDYNVRILAANTADALDNKVYFLSDQGIVALSDSDTQIMSFIIDKTIIENTYNSGDVKAYAWGVAYQSDRKYILNMPYQSGDKQYIYNHLTQVWTNWSLYNIWSAMVFRRDGKLYLDGLLQERKTFTVNDYADRQYPCTVTSVNGPRSFNATSVIVIDGGLGNFILDENVVGWTLRNDANGIEATITACEVNEFGEIVVTVDKDQPFAVDQELWMYQPIRTEVQTIQLDCNVPGMNKQFSEIVYIFTEQGFQKLTVTMNSNTSVSPITDILIPAKNNGWGIDPWGSVWGGVPRTQGKIRRYVPQAVQRAGWLYVNIVHEEAFTNFGWSGLELYYKPTSTRQK